MTDSYHFRIEPEPRAEGVWFDGYFLSEETSQLLFPSGAALQVSGDKIVGRVEAEPKRAPLPHFNQRTEFDPFKGFYNHPDARIRSSYVGFVTIEPEPNPDALPANVNLLRG